MPARQRTVLKHERWILFALAGLPAGPFRAPVGGTAMRLIDLLDRNARNRVSVAGEGENGCHLSTCPPTRLVLLSLHSVDGRFVQLSGSQ